MNLELWDYLWKFIPALFAALITQIIVWRRMPKLEMYPEEERPKDVVVPIAFRRIIVKNKKMWPPFGWLDFRDPALQCEAKLTFLNSKGEKMFEFKGRWASTIEVAHRSADFQQEKMLKPDPINIKAGRSEILDCVAHHDSDRDVAYPWLNWVYWHNEFKIEQWKMITGKYTIRVEVEPLNGKPCRNDFVLTVGKTSDDTRIRPKCR